jgi:rRNA maturation RNase YbeY
MPIRIHNRQRTVRIHTDAIKKRVGQIMTYLDCAEQELSIMFSNNALMQELNRTYRQRDYPTNVLAFAQPVTAAPAPLPLLGDVVVALSVAACEACALGQPLEERVVYLILHGLLHLLGYDHEGSAAQRRRMEKREREILAYLQLSAAP